MKIRNVFCVFVPTLLLAFCGTGVCPDPTEVRFNYSKILTFAPENAFSREVSLRIRLTDTTRVHYPFPSGLGHLGIPKAYGFSCPDPFFYVPNQRITGVQIKTLHNISPDFPVLSDVSNSFLAFPDEGFLFITIDEFIRYHLGIRVRFPENIPYSEFQIYLKERVDYPIARFVVTVSLSDGSLLSDTTRTINITSN